MSNQYFNPNIPPQQMQFPQQLPNQGMIPNNQQQLFQQPEMDQFQQQQFNYPMAAQQQQQQFRGQVFQHWEEQFVPQPPQSQFPGITNEQYNKFNIDQQREFQRFLRNVADYHKITIPSYQKAMYEFLKATPAHELSQEERFIMSGYIQEQLFKEQYDALLQFVKEQEEAQKKVQQQAQEKEEEQKSVMTTEPPKQEVKAPRKKLSKNAKAYTPPTLPPVPQYPSNCPSFIVLNEFKFYYQQYLDFYQPTDDFTKFPTPEEVTKKREQLKKKAEAQKKLEENKIYKRMERTEDNKFTVKEEKVNVEELTIDTNIFIEPDETRQALNLVLIGHVDAGKSTLCGRILMDLGEISEEDLRKFQQDAKENDRESWWLAYCMDINEEERAKGKTVECGKAYFQTKTKRFTLFDAPGHKNYIPNMIMGACQADVAGLIISARTGEFEAGFQKGGQTSEHAYLAKSLGVQQLVVIITKMDTVNWEKKRFDEITEAIQKFIQDYCHFEQLHIIPIDSLGGENCSSPVNPTKCNWYKGPHLLKFLDEVSIIKPNPEGPIRLSVLDKLRDQGLYIFGKLESGTLVDGLNVSLFPRKQLFQITGIFNSKDQRMKYAKAGENIKGIEEDDIQRGSIVCNLETNPVAITVEFQAMIRILELPEDKRIFSSGYNCVLHLHCLVEEVEINAVEALIDPETNQPMKQSFLKSRQKGIVKLQVVIYPITNLQEKADTISSLGRFALRDKGVTIGFGEVIKIKPYQAKKDQGPTQVLKQAQ